MEPELLWPQTGAKAQICRKELECFAQVSPSRVRHASMFHSMTKELPRCLRSNREAMRICIRICPPPLCPWQAIRVLLEELSIQGAFGDGAEAWTEHRDLG